MKYSTALGVCGAGLVSLLMVGCNEVNDTDIVYVGVAEVRELQLAAEKQPRQLLLVDPRSKESYEREHLPGAIHMEFRNDMKDRGVDPRLATYKNIIVYGDNPGSSAARGMAKRMMFIGYDDVRLFAGGLEEWRGMNYPLEAKGEGAKAGEEK